MNLSIISFTENGMKLSQKLLKQLEGMDITLFTKCKKNANVSQDNNVIFVNESIGDWAKTKMQEKRALLFIGACGIAVRAIAPHIVSKLCDIPVLVMDEKGEYLIPILSGHMGGANEIAGLIAGQTSAIVVITTATDINKKFAVDLFAKKNGFHIVNKDGIAKVSSKVLSEQEITISIEPGHFDENGKLPEGIKMVAYPPKGPVDIVVTSENIVFDTTILLKTKEYVIGVGCRCGKEAEKIEAFIEKYLEFVGISHEQILTLASIEQKRNEEGLLAWSRKNNIPFNVFTAEELQDVKGEFMESEFVKDKVGVSNVCERAAMKVCNETGKLVLQKQAEDGMTIAIAKREWRVIFDEE